MKELILASQSPRRKELLERAGLSFAVVPSNYEEDITLNLLPRKLVELLARGKAEEVAERYKSMGKIILGADTVIAFEGEIIGKPRDEEDARHILGRLSDKEHHVITGYSIIDTDSDESLTGSELTVVRFKPLTAKEINDYITTGEPLDKAGAYGIQSLGRKLVYSVDGDRGLTGNIDNVIGLPTSVVVKKLEEFGITPN